MERAVRCAQILDALGTITIYQGLEPVVVLIFNGRHTKERGKKKKKKKKKKILTDTSAYAPRARSNQSSGNIIFQSIQRILLLPSHTE